MTLMLSGQGQPRIIIWTKSEYDQEITQSHTQINPGHHEEEPQNIYSNK